MKNKELQDTIQALEKHRDALMPIANKLVINAIKTQFPLDQVKTLSIRESSPDTRDTKIYTDVHIRDLFEFEIQYDILTTYEFKYRQISVYIQRYGPFYKGIGSYINLYEAAAERAKSFLDILNSICNKALKVKPLEKSISIGGGSSGEIMHQVK